MDIDITATEQTAQQKAEENIITKVSEEFNRLKNAMDDLIKLADEIHSGTEIREYITAQVRNLQTEAKGWEAE